MKKQSGKNKLVLVRNLFLIKTNINRVGIFPLIMYQRKNGKIIKHSSKCVMT